MSLDGWGGVFYDKFVSRNVYKRASGGLKKLTFSELNYLLIIYLLQSY